MVLAVVLAGGAGLLAIPQAWLLADLIAVMLAGTPVGGLVTGAALVVGVLTVRVGLSVVAEIRASAAASRVKARVRV